MYINELDITFDFRFFLVETYVDRAPIELQPLGRPRCRLNRVQE